ncbi:putative sugar-binding domain protein [Enterococcus faecium TX1330]|nr:putative sugar-binding domain protein [Enterococcus faecium TX1330]
MLYFTKKANRRDVMDRADEKELVKIASMYYEEGMTQAEIAKIIGVSRSLVSKNLIDAKEAGLVEIFINSKSVYSVELERKLEQKFNLKSAIVVDTMDLAGSEVDKMIGRQAALYLQKASKKATKIGMSWGKSLRKLVDNYPFTNQPDVTVYPLIGGMGDDYVDIHSNQLSYDLARKMRGKAKYLYAPALVSNPRIKEDLFENPTIYSVIEEGRVVDIALVGVASPFEKSTMAEIGYIKEQDISELKKSGIKGDINSRFFDENGKEADCQLNKSVIGVNLEDIKKIPTVIGIAYGIEKVESIKLALEHQLINVIVTTDKVVHELLID